MKWINYQWANNSLTRHPTTKHNNNNNNNNINNTAYFLLLFVGVWATHFHWGETINIFMFIIYNFFFFILFHITFFIHNSLCCFFILYFTLLHSSTSYVCALERIFICVFAFYQLVQTLIIKCIFFFS